MTKGICFSAERGGDLLEAKVPGRTENTRPNEGKTKMSLVEHVPAINIQL